MHNDIGQNWLLLRGLSREAAHWGAFLPLLQSRFPSARITTLDLPGTGRLYRQTCPCRMDEITESVRKQALEQGLLSRPLTVVGLSLGGMLTWEWMLRHPDDICGAALINTSLASLSPFYRRMRWQSYPDFFKIMLLPNLYRRELAILEWVANRRDWDREIALKWEKIQRARPVSLRNSLRQITAAAHYRPGDEKPEPPILLLNGRGDRLVAPACSSALQQKWQLQLETHPWAGHDLTLDDGAWVADRLEAWIKQLRDDARTI
ncbi:alpha/beta hydrolase [Methylomonas sp. LL1]|uniref:alpha/beta fold hydrolase n=1 Tax=Methylomonas sp. LL1 TaxID=2785785 RepID=UPI0018C3BFD1|nr:alpha/beta hydrolase [Methylomonas sp. LL1]QPK64148.1 alpha/beta hydrolase [Methylomonas sp. LL1]